MAVPSRFAVEAAIPQRNAEHAVEDFWSELEHVFSDTDARNEWLESANPNLGGLSPTKAIEAGRVVEVLDLVRSILYVGMS